MTEESRYLKALAERVAEPYLSHPEARAAMVSGSVAEGESDRYSDVDMMVYYADTLPTDEELDRAREAQGGSPLQWSLGGNPRDVGGEQGAVMQSYFVRGIEFQLVHSLMGKTDETIAAVHSGEEIGTPLNKALSGIAEGIPLFGDEIIALWKARIAEYPESLAIASVQKYLNFTPLWGIADAMASRDGTIWRHQILVENSQNLLCVLAGLNRLYFTTFQFKRMARFIARMTIKPDRFAERLESTFTLDPLASAAVMKDLTEETLALVEQYLPTVDTAAARKRAGMARKRWDLPRDAL